MAGVDLHIHSTASDGRLSPQEVVRKSAGGGLRVIALADHDTVDGVVPALEAARGFPGLRVIPAVEISTDVPNGEVHVLGYFIDYKNPEFVKKIRKFKESRYERGENMVAKLNDLGVNLSMDTVKGIAGESPVGRPHVADALLKEEFVRTYDEAFARYLGYHAPAYVPKTMMTVSEAIDLIHLVRGVAILAHPGTLRHDEYVPDLIEMGLDGIEAYHSQHSKNDVNNYKNMARKFGVIFTGGSDCHGPRKGKILIGSQRVPYSVLEGLRKVKETK